MRRQQTLEVRARRSRVTGDSAQRFPCTDSEATREGCYRAARQGWVSRVVRPSSVDCRCGVVDARLWQAASSQRVALSDAPLAVVHLPGPCTCVSKRLVTGSLVPVIYAPGPGSAHERAVKIDISTRPAAWRGSIGVSSARRYCPSRLLPGGWGCDLRKASCRRTEGEPFAVVAKHSGRFAVVLRLAARRQLRLASILSPGT